MHSLHHTSLWAGTRQLTVLALYGERLPRWLACLLRLDRGSVPGLVRRQFAASPAVGDIIYG